MGVYHYHLGVEELINVPKDVKVEGLREDTQVTRLYESCNDKCETAEEKIARAADRAETMREKVRKNGSRNRIRRFLRRASQESIKVR